MSVKSLLLTVSGTILSLVQAPLEVQPSDSPKMKLAKAVAGLVVFPPLAIAGIVEGIARGAFALLAKALTFFLPSNFPFIEQIDAAVAYLLHSTAINMVAVPIVAILDLMQGWGNGTSEEKTKDAMQTQLGNAIVGEEPISPPIQALSHAHINGSSTPPTRV